MALPPPGGAALGGGLTLHHYDTGGAFLVGLVLYPLVAGVVLGVWAYTIFSLVGRRWGGSGIGRSLAPSPTIGVALLAAITVPLGHHLFDFGWFALVAGLLGAIGLVGAAKLLSADGTDPLQVVLAIVSLPAALPFVLIVSEIATGPRPLVVISGVPPEAVRFPAFEGEIVPFEPTLLLLSSAIVAISGLLLVLTERIPRGNPGGGGDVAGDAG